MVCGDGSCDVRSTGEDCLDCGGGGAVFEDYAELGNRYIPPLGAK